MRKIKTLWKRFISKLKIWQTAIIALLFLLLSIGLYSHLAEIPMNKGNFYLFICLVICLACFLVFLANTIDKLVDKSDKKEEREALKKIQQMLNDSYKKVKYESPNDTESLVTRLKTQAIERVGLELYARLDEENNIWLVYKDEKGNNVTDEKKKKSYRSFLYYFTIDE